MLLLFLQTNTITQIGKVVVSNTWAYDTDGTYHETFENDAHYWNYLDGSIY